MERFDEGNTTLAICPVSSSSPSNNSWLELNINSQNSGMMIESRVPKGKVIFEDNSDYLKINLQDYFTGTNTSFGIVGRKTSKELKCRFSRDSLLKFVIDSVSDVNIIKHTFIINDTYLILIYEYTAEIQVRAKNYYKFIK